MKTKILSLTFCILLLITAVSFTVSAEDEAPRLNRLTDAAGLLTDDEYFALLDRLDEISERQGCDVVIITVAELDDDYTPTEFADDVFDYYGFGLGEDRSGILFLLSMEERDWAISTRGYGITAFTDAGQKYIMNKIKGDLSDNNFAAAFNTFADQCDLFLTQAKTAEPYDNKNLPVSITDLICEFLLCFVIGVIPALFITNGMKSKLKTVHKATQAGNYTVPDSLNLHESRDMFITRYISKSVRQTSDSSDSSGGSSTHTSSSGATHGGSSGKF